MPYYHIIISECKAVYFRLAIFGTAVLNLTIGGAASYVILFPRGVFFLRCGYADRVIRNEVILMKTAKSNNIKRWITLISGSIILLFMGLIYAWSLFRIPLQELFPGWTRMQISFTFTISIFVFCVGGFVSGKLLQRFKAKSVLYLSAALLLTGFCSLSLLLDEKSPNFSLIALYVLYGVVCGFGVGLTYNAAISVVARLFPELQGLATGILLMCFGIGGMLLGGFVDIVYPKIGIISTFAVCGVLIAIVVIAGSFFITEKTVNSAKFETDGSHKNYTLGEALNTKTFWIFCVWVVAVCTCGLLILNVASSIVDDFGLPVVLGGIVSVFNGIGRFGFGVFIDRSGRNIASLVNSSILLLAGFILLLGALFHSTMLILIGLPLIGLTYGGAPTLVTATMSRLYGSLYFPIIYGAATFSVAISAILGPMISSKLQDISGGRFHTTFIMIIIVAVITLCFHFMTIFFSEKEKLNDGVGNQPV
jgi:OFA family oxalate/formate antiporter-like MFS transporter